VDLVPLETKGQKIPTRTLSLLIRTNFSISMRLQVDLFPLETKGQKVPTRTLSLLIRTNFSISMRLQVLQTFANPVTVNPDVWFLSAILIFHLFMF
jgi:hypothetical protein